MACVPLVHAQLTVGAKGENRDWYSLTPAEARKGLPVEIIGTVLLYDLPWNQLYVFDGHQAIYLVPQLYTNHFAPGQRIRIEARTSWGNTVPLLTNAVATILNSVALPEAPRVAVHELAGSAGQWVEVHGVIRVAEASHGRVTLILDDGGQKCLVYVMQTSTTNHFEQFADAQVRIRGINASRTAGEKLVSAILFCPGLDQITSVAPPIADRWSLPVTPIDTILTRPLGSWTNEPVHINGEAFDYRPGQALTVKDPTGVFPAEVIQVDPLLENQRVDCWGFVRVRTNGVVLADAYFRYAGKKSGETVRVRNKLADGKPLTSIKEVRALSKEQANENHAAVIRGVVTFVDAEWRLGFMQDEHDAIFFDASQAELQVGDLVEVQGRTEGGGFAPDLVDSTAKILGTNGLPAPLTVGLQDAVNGHLDSHWVEMEGVVRRVTKENGRLSLNLTGRDGRFTATVLDQNSEPPPTAWVDSQIRIRGACGAVVNSRGQFNGVLLHVPGRDQIEVIDPSPADPFAARAVPISKVATFDPERLAGRRVKISGVVNLTLPGRDLFVQDASGGIRISTAETNHFLVGERVDILGFPEISDFSPVLEEAAIRSVGFLNCPAAEPTTAAEILRQGQSNGKRVELQAQVIQTFTRNARPKLLLQDGAIVFTAQAVQGFQSALPELAAGSIVKLRGVCVIQGDENNEPANFHLLIGSSDDVILVQGVPWWTFKHTLVILGGTTLASLLALLWGFLLRQQVRKQTEIIRQNQKQLMETSRLAGMAEIATNVLHNVGNVLNSVNVSTTLMQDRVKKSRLNNLGRVATLIDEQRDNLPVFFAEDPKGRQLPVYLANLAEHLAAEHEALNAELELTRKNVEHIKNIVARQQDLAKVGGVLEEATPRDVMEDALLAAGNLEHYGIVVKRKYASGIEAITTEKHKLLQILVNLISNAKNACVESGRSDREITLGLEQAEECLSLWVRDNGVGIAPENLVRIFHHGFTTRDAGHGFGLHSGAIFAKELGGQLTVHSDGPGRGALFTLKLPLNGAAGQDAPMASPLPMKAG